MRNQKLTALLLAGALVVGLCGAAVFADEPAQEEPASSVQVIGGDTTREEEHVSQDIPADGEQAVQPEAENGTEKRENVAIVEGTNETGSQDVAGKDTDAAGTVSFENLEKHLRDKNLNILALDKSIASIEAIDYEEMERGLEMAIAMAEQQQEKLGELLEGTVAAVNGLQSVLDSQSLEIDITGFKPALTAYPQATISSMSTQIASYKATLDDLRSGAIEEEASAGVRQMSGAQDQIVLGGQTLYISLLGLEQTQRSLNRQLAALDRSLEELELRYEMGQISALTLAEVKAGRSSMVSGMTTLDMNVTSLKRQLEAMIGEKDFPGTIRLQPLTAVTDKQLNAMDLEKDLKQAMRVSDELYAADKAVFDAREELDALEKNPIAADYEIESAEYTVKAAKLSLEAAEQNFRLSFAALYDKVLDQKQILNAARTTLAVKQDNLAVAQLKYEQGTISYNALLDAKDALADAQDTVDTAAVDLFTAYNNYRWAVNCGILN